MAPRGDFFTFFLPTRIGEGYSQAPYAQNWPNFWKKSGKFTPPPPGPQKSQIYVDLIGETPEIREKSGKNGEKMGIFLGGGGGVGGGVPHSDT